MAHVLLGSYLVVCLLALTWPGAAWAARVEPRVLGLPFAFAWQIGWILATCVAMGAYHWVRHGPNAPYRRAARGEGPRS
jgi:hypothetical protein